MRQIDVHDFCAQIAIGVNCCFDRGADFAVKTFAEERARNSDALSLDLWFKFARVIGHRHIGGGSVVSITSGNYLQHRRGITRGSRKDADLI